MQVARNGIGNMRSRTKAVIAHRKRGASRLREVSKTGKTPDCQLTLSMSSAWRIPDGEAQEVPEGSSTRLPSSMQSGLVTDIGQPSSALHQQLSLRAASWQCLLSMLPQLQEIATPEAFSMDFFEYKPDSLEVCVGQMVELWPPVSYMRSCTLFVASRLPLGVMLDKLTGLVVGRPCEPTEDESCYITAITLGPLPQVRVSVALIKLKVQGGDASERQYPPGLL